MGTPLIRAWYALAVSFMACVIIALAGVMYTNHVQQTANQRWCKLFAVLNPSGAPPTTGRGKVIADEIARMRHEFDCSDMKP